MNLQMAIWASASDAAAAAAAAAEAAEGGAAAKELQVQQNEPELSQTQVGFVEVWGGTQRLFKAALSDFVFFCLVCYV